jgi:hypothetical protein
MRRVLQSLGWSRSPSTDKERKHKQNLKEAEEARLRVQNLERRLELAEFKRGGSGWKPSSSR